MIRMRGATALLLRGVRLDARSIWTYITRTLLVVLLLLACAATAENMRYESAPGRLLFSFITAANFCFINLAGMSLFASIITEERSQGTLGLMRMTDLNAVSILLGKLGGRLLNVMLLLIVQLPPVMLAITLGGLNGNEIMQTYAMLIAYTAMVGGLTALLSTLCATTPTVTVYFIGILAAAWAVPPMVFFGLLEDNMVRSRIDLMLGVNVADRLNTIFETLAFATPLVAWVATLEMGPDLERTTTMVVVHLVAGLLFFVLAWALFERCAMRTGGGGSGGWRMFWRRGKKRLPDSTAVGAAPGAPSNATPNATSTTAMATGMAKPVDPAVARRRFRRQRAWASAHAWHAFEFGCGGSRGMAGRVVLWSVITMLPIGFLLLMMMLDPYGVNGPRGVEWLEVIGGSMQTVGAIGLGVEALIIAAMLFRDDLQDKMMPTLVMLPHSVGHLCLTRLAGRLPALIFPSLLVLIGVCLWTEPADELMREMDEIWPYAFAATVFAFLAVVAAVSLYFDWSAVPLAVGGYLAAGFVFALTLEFFDVHDDDTAAFLWMVINAIVCAAALYLIPLRIRKLAASE